MRLFILPTSALCFALAYTAVAAAEPEFTDEFPLEDCEFVTSGGNPFFKLKPGRQLYLSNQQCVATGECDELEELWITVLNETKTVVLKDDGRQRRITTRVVEERETADGELVEISRNFFATCRPFNDVYYFGEEVDIYEDGKIVSHEGAWLAGKNRAEPGIIMPDSGFLLGSRYFQELAPGVATGPGAPRCHRSGDPDRRGQLRRLRQGAGNLAAGSGGIDQVLLPGRRSRRRWRLAAAGNLFGQVTTRTFEVCRGQYRRVFLLRASPSDPRGCHRPFKTFRRRLGPQREACASLPCFYPY